MSDREKTGQEVREAEEAAKREQVARGKKDADPHPGNESLGALERCRNDRDSMKPHETAECAGKELEEAYQNEEDGGS